MIKGPVGSNATVVGSLLNSAWVGGAAGESCETNGVNGGLPIVTRAEILLHANGGMGGARRSADSPSLLQGGLYGSTGLRSSATIGRAVEATAFHEQSQGPDRPVAL